MEPALIVSSIFTFLDLAMRFRNSLQQSNAWTPEQEQKFWQKVAEAQAEIHWQPSGRVAPFVPPATSHLTPSTAEPEATTVVLDVSPPGLPSGTHVLEPVKP